MWRLIHLQPSTQYVHELKLIGKILLNIDVVESMDKENNIQVKRAYTNQECGGGFYSQYLSILAGKQNEPESLHLLSIKTKKEFRECANLN